MATHPPGFFQSCLLLHLLKLLETQLAIPESVICLSLLGWTCPEVQVSQPLIDTCFQVTSCKKAKGVSQLSVFGKCKHKTALEDSKFSGYSEPWPMSSPARRRVLK